MSFETLSMENADGICTVRFTRAQAGNAINAAFIAELSAVVDACAAADGPSVLVLHGSAEVFCAGGDFQATAASDVVEDPAPLYELWQRLATGPFIAIACVRGRVNAGGVGLVAACDIVLAESTASFALSELLFGLFPACVLPFLVRRVGVQKAHYLTLSTQAISAAQALEWGLADGVADPVEDALRKHLLRLRRLNKAAVGGYKAHMAGLAGLEAAKPAALAANRTMFSDPAIRAGIRRYVAERKFPWED
ncbi:enoyl-CoA hydratase/isomerase [Magnetospirillum sulfuroxidans]|uniref:Enoyl-CoA hydratase/isomerase n=1 Tax=Magnetospirillum sulfuroxidans TaxID=611300 RepID=A0ABS5I7F5_9PROT|nr:enoyl-CoA hydratase/isomerase [Magnetospirillum sulfuroxidans]MBR9970335.1 enoyl-CoA hydratase/isomerase [Magnetospirillum sulfuroxidans]